MKEFPSTHQGTVAKTGSVAVASLSNVYLITRLMEQISVLINDGGYRLNKISSEKLLNKQTTTTTSASINLGKEENLISRMAKL